MPTITTKVIYHDKRIWTYGEDFNITYRTNDMEHNLTNGENVLNDTVKLNFEQIYSGPFYTKLTNAYIITPLNFREELVDRPIDLIWAFNQENITNHLSLPPLISMTNCTEMEM